MPAAGCPSAGGRAAARTALELLAAVLLVLFLVFFLLKNGPAMWSWLLRVPSGSR